MASLGRLSRALLRAPLHQTRQFSAAAGEHEGGRCTKENDMFVMLIGVWLYHIKTFCS